MMKAIPFTIHETKAGQVLTMLAEPEGTTDHQTVGQQLSATNSEIENGDDSEAVK